MWMEMTTRRPCMLIADGAKENRRVLGDCFEQEYEVLEAKSGQDVLDTMEHRKIDIVLLAKDMPVMDGAEVLARLKADARFASVPVVGLLDHGDLESGIAMMEMGAADAMTQPYHPLIARSRVKNVMAFLENEWRKMEQIEQEKQILELSRQNGEDPLTRLYNREKFFSAAAELMQKNSDIKYAIVYLDIRHFKSVSILCESGAGDLILKSAAACFARFTKDGGLCARLETDHFALCMPSEDLSAEEIIRAVDEEMRMLLLPHAVLFHAGVYRVDNPFLPVAQMCDRAAMALSTIRDSLQSRVAFYDEAMKERLREEQMLLREMEYAIEQKQFKVYLQPIYSTEEQRDVGAEALTRWEHPEEGIIFPNRFIPLFERNGFIVRFDRYVWEEVCRILADEREKLGRIVPVSVNVSRLDFYDGTLFDFLEGLLEKYCLEPWMLHLEITESIYADNPQELIRTMKKFQEKGFKFIMDDFGLGYSSLSMIRNLAVDILKIDMRFVQGMEAYRATKIVEHMVDFARDIGMDVIIEGVETKEQVEFLQEIGCDVIQGYYFSHPLPFDDYIWRLAESPVSGRVVALD